MLEPPLFDKVKRLSFGIGRPIHWSHVVIVCSVWIPIVKSVPPFGIAPFIPFRVCPVVFAFNVGAAGWIQVPLSNVTQTVAPVFQNVWPTPVWLLQLASWRFRYASTVWSDAIGMRILALSLTWHEKAYTQDSWRRPSEEPGFPSRNDLGVEWQQDPRWEIQMLVLSSDRETQRPSWDVSVLYLFLLPQNRIRPWASG